MIRRTRATRGITMGLVLIVLFIIFVVTGAMTGYSIQHLDEVQSTTRNSEAFYAAGAGVADAEDSILSNSSYSTNISSTALPNGAGSYSVLVTNNVSGGSDVHSSNGIDVPPTYIYLLSTGVDASGVNSRKIGVLINVPSNSVVAVFGKKSLGFSGNATVDSWNSNNGTYTQTKTTNPTGVTVGTNGNSAGVVSLSGNTTINANVEVGVGGNTTTDITSSGGASITGSKTVNTSNVVLTVPSAPTSLAVRTAVKFSGRGTSTLSPGAYQSFSTSGQVTVIFTSGTYYFPGGFSTSGGSTLELDITNGPVKIYYGGSFDGSGGSFINSTGVPSNLQIYGTSSATSAKITGGSGAYFTFYAPTADVQISGNGDIYGSVVGNTITDTGNGAIHFDQALLANNNSSGTPSVVSFQRF